MIDAVVFDVGETLVDETRQHGQWADWLGIPRHTFSAVFGGMVATGREFRDALRYFRPDFDLATERRRRAEAGLVDEFTEADLYPDTRASLAALSDQGLGDRVDNDVKPAKAAGLHPIYLRRGPWGFISAEHPDLAGHADRQVGSLAEIPPLLAAVNQG